MDSQSQDDLSSAVAVELLNGLTLKVKNSKTSKGAGITDVETRLGSLGYEHCSGNK